MGLILKEEDLREELELFEILVSSSRKYMRGSKNRDPSRLLFEIYDMSKPKRAKLFHDSAVWVDPKIVDLLLQEDKIQLVPNEGLEEYTLTFKGIADCIEQKYNIGLEEQFKRFLEISDQKYAFTTQTSLSDREKWVSLTLIILASTSESSALRLDNETNKNVLKEAFERTLESLKTHNIVGQNLDFFNIKRSEAQASAQMSRTDKLARKTNQYYKFGRGEVAYFFEIERDGTVDKRRLDFLFRKIFDHYDKECDYKELYDELEKISHFYSPKFLSRPPISPTIMIGVLQGLKDFFYEGILQLPLKE